MKRTVAISSAFAVLAAWLSVATFAGSVADQDGDGVPDAFDNCVDTRNGPLASTGACDSQEDGDLDGYGNICDTDLNNDGATGLDDVSIAFQAAILVSTDPVKDINCDSAAGLDDISIVFADAAVLETPGPTGLACAGTVPCVAN